MGEKGAIAAFENEADRSGFDAEAGTVQTTDCCQAEGGSSDDAAQEARNLQRFQEAEALLAKGSVDSLSEARKIYEELGSWGKAQDRIAECDKVIKRLHGQLRRLVLSIASFLVIAATLYMIFYVPAFNYSEAVEAFRHGKYEEAYVAFEALGSYRDAADYAEKAASHL